LQHNHVCTASQHHTAFDTNISMVVRCPSSRVAWAHCPRDPISPDLLFAALSATLTDAYHSVMLVPLVDNKPHNLKSSPSKPANQPNPVLTVSMRPLYQKEHPETGSTKAQFYPVARSRSRRRTPPAPYRLDRDNFVRAVQRFIHQPAITYCPTNQGNETPTCEPTSQNLMLLD